MSRFGWSLNTRAIFEQVNVYLYIISCTLRSIDLILQKLSDRSIELLRAFCMLMSLIVIFANFVYFGIMYFIDELENPQKSIIMMIIRMVFIFSSLYKFLTICSFILSEKITTGHFRMDLFETLQLVDNSRPTFSFKKHRDELRKLKN